MAMLDNMIVAGAGKLMRIAQAWPSGSFNGAIKNRPADPRERVSSSHGQEKLSD
jgi:hypothetical protein